MVELSSGVETLIQTPRQEEISLIIRTEENSMGEVRDSLISIGEGEVVKITPTMLSVTIEDTLLKEITEVNGIDRIEVEGQGRVLEAGNL